MRLLIPFNVRRFIVVAFFAALVVFGTTSIEVPLLDDDTVLGYGCFIAWLVVSWPLIFIGMFVDWLPIMKWLPGGLLPACSILSGLVWAFFVEVRLGFKKRQVLNQHLLPTPR